MFEAALVVVVAALTLATMRHCDDDGVVEQVAASERVRGRARAADEWSGQPSRAVPWNRTPSHPAVMSAPENQSPRDRAQFDLLQSEIYRVAAEDMEKRGASILRCLQGITLSGAENIRFSVDVSSDARDVSVGQWRFVEVASGEPLPESFGQCSETELGGGYRIAPPPGLAFPEYAGDVALVYRIPAPADP